MTQTTGRGEVDKNTLGALVALCFFVAGIAFWPVQWLDGMPLAAFVAHGMMAWRFAAGRLGMVWWWSLPVVLVSAWLMPGVSEFLCKRVSG